ncbi:MAG: transferrin receptor-like dimerization domain-containing protein [Rubricoccaceae bacterium]
MLRSGFALTLLVCLVSPLALAQDLLGFTESRAEEQRAIEQQYDSHLQASDLEAWMRELTDKPFYVGSPGARENARTLQSLFEQWGYETEIATYHVLFPTPTERQLELVHPVPYTARLEEPPVEGDASSRFEGLMPTYNAYSADGDVTAELVYVNYGVPADYEELERLGVSVEGKIVIARYGGAWRGIKPKVAAEHGAIGAILYSDPRDDGYWQGDVYPEGPFRNEWGVQRGAVQDMPQYPGDPLTPGIGATEDAERLAIEDAPTIMKIPVLPISYADAQPLLEQIGGPVAPPSWRGGLPLTYHIGPGPARVHLKLAFDWSLHEAENVVARMPGARQPDEWVLRGNHRDGWAMGAADPISGIVAMLAEAKAIGELARSGHRPDRTLVYAAWDAEEPGLLGSTEWVEHHADELREKAVAYINTDGSGRGFLGMGGSHTLERLINQVARDVTDPQTGVPVLERARARQALGNASTPMSGDLPISPLGSGSDYSPFLQHLGIASLNLGFGGENRGGSYHSQYDSFEHYTRFGDPGFAYGVALAKVAGRATLRLANADVIPLRFGNFTEKVATYLDEVKALADQERMAAERRNQLLGMNAYRLAADPTKTYVAPDSIGTVPYLNFAPLANAVAALEAAATEYDDALAMALDRGLSASSAQQVNELMIRTERLMTREQGLPRRPWYRHMIYAPGYYTGYGVKTFPGVREGLEEEGYDEAETYVDVIAERLRAVTEAVENATRLLSAP